MRTHFRAVLLGIVVVAAALVATPGLASAAGSSPAAEPYVVKAASINWTDCGGGFQCGTLSVPLNYQDPSGAAINLALTRLPASNPSQRIGSLLVNPGGPGASAIDFMRAWVQSLSSSIRSRFDIVAFDPRGVGYSSPIVCHDTLQQFVAADPDPTTQQQWQEDDAVAKTFVDGCTSKYANILPYLGTNNVARDMESVRQALGEDKITYLGYSYGTAIGQVYADMYPGHVRAMVLDGAMNLALSFDQSNEQQMVGFERTYQDYLSNCKQTSCGLTKLGDPQTVVASLLDQADKTPIPAPGADRPAGEGETLLAIIDAMYSQYSWPQLTNALLQALNNHNGTQLVAMADQYLERNPDGSYPNLMEANMAVNYDDEVCPKDPTAYQQLATQWAKSSPTFGASAAASGVTCAYWPYTPDPPAVPKAVGAPPIVVVDTTGDPATPYEEGLAVSQQLVTAHLLINRGVGHTIYAQGNQCIDQAVNNYLLTLDPPASGTTCGNGPPPPESATSPTATASSSATTPPASATPGVAATPTQHAPGPPDTGNGQGSGTGRVAAIMLAFVVVAAALAGIAVGIQRTRRR